MTKQEEAEQLFTGTEPKIVPVDIEDGPLPATMREALTWMRNNGVAECTFPDGMKVVLRPNLTPRLPAQSGVLDLEDPKKAPDDQDLVIGGYNAEILFAASK